MILTPNLADKAWKDFANIVCPLRPKIFALCVDNGDYKASLIPGKAYPVVPDARAAKDELIRIVDESGEELLVPQELFRDSSIFRRRLEERFSRWRAEAPSSVVPSVRSSVAVEPIYQGFVIAKLG